MAKFLLNLLFAFPLILNAYRSPGHPSDVVDDFTSTLTVEQKQDLIAMLGRVEKETNVEFAVVLVNDLGGDTVEHFALRLFEEWGIGKKGQDNGLLLLIAVADRKMRFEVGYGLEWVIPDAYAYHIINDVLKPAFKQGDFYNGIARAIEEIDTRIKLIIKEASKEFVPATLFGSIWLAIYWPEIVVYLIIALIVLFFIMLIIINRHNKTLHKKFLSQSMLFLSRIMRAKGSKGKRGNGGGFGGFGGGKSGGGGSSGGW